MEIPGPSAGWGAGWREYKMAILLSSCFYFGLFYTCCGLQLSRNIQVADCRRHWVADPHRLMQLFQNLGPPVGSFGLSWQNQWYLHRALQFERPPCRTCLLALGPARHQLSTGCFWKAFYLIGLHRSGFFENEGGYTVHHRRPTGLISPIIDPGRMK